MEKNQQFVSTLSVKAYRLCQLPRGGSQLRPGLQGLQNQNDALALPSGELSSKARLRGRCTAKKRRAMHDAFSALMVTSLPEPFSGS